MSVFHLFIEFIRQRGHTIFQRLIKNYYILKRNTIFQHSFKKLTQRFHTTHHYFKNETIYLFFFFCR